MGGDRGEPSSSSPGHTCGYEIDGAQSFDRTARGRRAAGEWDSVGSGVKSLAVLSGRVLSRVTDLRAHREVYFGVSALCIARSRMVRLLGRRCGSRWPGAGSEC